MREIPKILLLLLILLIPSVVFPQSEVPPETLALIAEAGGLDRFPDANAIVILEDIKVDYDSDGRYVSEEYGLVKILTEAGKREFGELHFPYYRRYDEISIDLARVIKPDSTTIDVPPDMIRDITQAAAAKMNIYEPNARERVVTFKNLEIGDAVEYRVKDVCIQTPIEGHFDDYRLFQGLNPILKKVYRVSGPKELPLFYVVRNGELKFERRELDDRITYTWSAEDVPRIIPEPDMPALPDIATKLLVTTSDSWREISRWWYGLVKPKMAPGQGIKEEVARLTEGLETDEEKVRAIYHFVAQKVRYMGLGTGRKAGFEPKPVDETYERRYGVCRDVATLMVSMLRLAGIEAWPVLTNPSFHIEREVPSLQFNHAIVAISDGRGGVYFSDPTVENCPDLLISMEYDQEVLICDEDGEELGMTPHRPAEENMGHISAHSVVDTEGNLSGKLTYRTSGFYDIALRSWSKRMPPAKLRMIWERIIQGIYPGARLTDFTISDTEDLYSPFTIELAFEMSNYALKAGDYLLVKSPVSTGSFELLARSFFSSASLPERRYPLDFQSTFASLEEETIEFPRGYRVKALPDPVSIERYPIYYEMRYVASPGNKNGGPIVRYVKEVKVDSKRISPEQYRDLKEVLRASARSGRGEIIMVKERGGKLGCMSPLRR